MTTKNSTPSEQFPRTTEGSVTNGSCGVSDENTRTTAPLRVEGKINGALNWLHNEHQSQYVIITSELSYLQEQLCEATAAAHCANAALQEQGVQLRAEEHAVQEFRKRLAAKDEEILRERGVSCDFSHEVERLEEALAAKERECEEAWEEVHQRQVKYDELFDEAVAFKTRAESAERGIETWKEQAIKNQHDLERVAKRFTAAESERDTMAQENTEIGLELCAAETSRDGYKARCEALANNILNSGNMFEHYILAKAALAATEVKP